MAFLFVLMVVEFLLPTGKNEDSRFVQIVRYTRSLLIACSRFFQMISGQVIRYQKYRTTLWSHCNDSVQLFRLKFVYSDHLVRLDDARTVNFGSVAIKILSMKSAVLKS